MYRKEVLEYNRADSGRTIVPTDLQFRGKTVHGSTDGRRRYFLCFGEETVVANVVGVLQSVVS